MNSYSHTQRGKLMLVVLLVLALSYSWAHRMISDDTGNVYFMSFIMLSILVVLTSFSVLHTQVDEQYVRLKFGFGLFKKKFTLSEITSVKTVKNRWYIGWGIRFWFWPRMWVYNVAGYDAVQITMKNNKIYRIGTDEPQELEQAIRLGLKGKQ